MPKIAIIGAFSGKSIGDEAILDSTCLHLQEVFPEDLQIILPTKYAAYMSQHFPVKAIQSRIGMLSPQAVGAALSADAVLFTQQNFFHRNIFKPWYNQMSAYRLIVQLAPKRGIKVITYNSGVGPLDTPLSRSIARIILNKCDWCTFRDPDSYELAKEIGVNTKDMTVTADPALSQPSCPDERAAEIINESGLDPTKDCIAWNIAHDMGPKGPVECPFTLDEFASLMTQGIKRLQHSTGCQILLAPTTADDLALSRQVAQACELETVGHIPWKISPKEYVGVVKNCGLLVGMRLHSLIMTCAAHTPVFAVPYHPKVESFMDFIGIPEMKILLKDMTSEALAEKVGNAWACREETRQKITPAIKTLAEKAKSSAYKLKETLSTT